jgi:hypothetical protein
MTQKRRSTTMLRLEALETREVPSASHPAVVAQENFAGTAVGDLPAGWTQWDSQATFQVLPGHSQNGNAALVASGSSGESARAWLAGTYLADVQVSTTLRLDSLIPAEILLRGRALDTTTPTYYDLKVTRGLDLQIWRVVNGNRTYLGSVRSNDYLSGAWLRVSFQADGNTLRAMIYRLDTHQYLGPTGQWEKRSTWALIKNDSAIQGAGYVGLGRQSGYAGDTVFSDFQTSPLSRGVVTTSATKVQQFSDATVGGLPPGWVQWSDQAPAAVSLNPSADSVKSLQFQAGSTNIARAWISDNLPANLEMTASAFVNNLIPSEVFVRGHGLDTSSPTYYSVTLTRGLNLQLWRVVDGVRTSLGVVRSNDYLSGVWVRVALDVEGAVLRVRVQRLDSGKYLNASGRWQRSESWALVRTDNTISGPGKVGLGREPGYIGVSTFDNLLVTIPNAPPPDATLAGLTDGAPISVPTTVQVKIGNSVIVKQVQFLVDGHSIGTDSAAPFQWTINPGSFSSGPHQLTVKVIDSGGSATTLEKDFTVLRSSPSGAGIPIGTPPSVASIPSHYSYIRLAELAYFGMTFGPLEDRLLRNSVDLVIPDVRFLNQINNAAPNTPQLLYTNASSLYESSLSDWLNYADAHGINREDAFYHVASATPFGGASPSSKPVDWFWGVYANKPDGTLADWTSKAHSWEGVIPLGEQGQSLYLGYTDQFREINFNLAAGAAQGWRGVLEYATAVDGNGNPTGWTRLQTLTDTTVGLKRSGQITFDPPSDWKTGSVGGSARLYYVRIRTISSGKAPVVRTVLGRDYVHAYGGQSGTIPAFDYSADLDHDGYLNDIEYAHRNPAMNARFAYESRLFLGYYGQMRPATNPSNANFRAWLINYEERFLRSSPLADGVFVDNSGGKPPASNGAVLENTFNYTADYASLMNALTKAVAPHWVVVNTSNGTSGTTAIVGGTAAYFEEFALRPLSGTYQQFEDLAGAVTTRRIAHGSTPPYAILDSLPLGGSPTDPRTQLATLAEYYLLADPKYSFLDFYGGYAPSTQWSQHFTAAVNYNVGQPRGEWTLFTAGLDPSNRSLTYHVYARQYENALVYYKPLSYSPASGMKGSLGGGSATTIYLRGSYRPLHADGKLGGPVTSIQLRNGEGAVLVPA